MILNKVYDLKRYFKVTNCCTNCTMYSILLHSSTPLITIHVNNYRKIET